MKLVPRTFAAYSNFGLKFRLQEVQFGAVQSLYDFPQFDRTDAGLDLSVGLSTIVAT